MMALQQRAVFFLAASLACKLVLWAYGHTDFVLSQTSVRPRFAQGGRAL